MKPKIDLALGLAELYDRDLLTDNSATLVSSIEPGEVNTAATSLLWTSFGIENIVEPPTFETALYSRTVDVREALRWHPNIPDRRNRGATWKNANEWVIDLTTTQLLVARKAIQIFGCELVI